MAWFKKASVAAQHIGWDPVTSALLRRVSERLDALEAALAKRDVPAPAPQTGVKEWLPVLDRMHEIALVAMGHPDLAQQFGLTSRQRAEVEPTTTWEEPKEPDEGMTYG